ncbi:uncharacterized protein EI90DRAFT_3065763 [Cantharellus anzutake]|uniref:uncharacterized protein n=1 Tax=Cantharellus anzutake TaxID=1750568 RepID=UPI001904AF70|nr:uncharacterized protein EI90DRAFT_3065763 [Cantharellus anzutake]KAF8328157.1 hypothetical protein EI90DRAFT_3065763 [Cantharellus anzutake]
MGVLYDLSFAFFVFLTGASVLASGASLGYQALFSASDTVANWNVIAIVGSYVALVRQAGVCEIYRYLTARTGYRITWSLY